MNPRTDGQLLIPATQAARKLGITRQTLRKHIKAGLLRSVKVGSRSSILQSEIDRIVRGEAKPETPTGISASGKNAGNVCQIRYIQEVGEQSDALPDCGSERALGKDSRRVRRVFDGPGFLTRRTTYLAHRSNGLIVQGL